MFGKTLCTMLTLISLGFAASVRAADDPNIHEVYAAAEAGRFAEAQRMMDKVLQDHPNSGKAHFVEAELLAKQGRMSEAGAELKKAETLSPGMPFAKPASVQRLEQLVARSQVGPSTTYVAQQRANIGGGVPWLTLLFGGGVIAAVFYWLRGLFARRSAPVAYAPNAGGAGYGYGAPAGQMPSVGGVGSTIVGGLATGAAVGAGMVAGEALAHHFLDGNRRDDRSYQPPVDNGFVQDDDLGGADFGLNDSSSWDDSSGGDDNSW